MTIKDIEMQTGMTRANIRFYETEGLLTPARSPNGYRDYSSEDLEVLKRIKLLRTLRISLEEIKLLDSGDEDLIHALDRHIAGLDMERNEIDRSQRVCHAIRRDGADYHTLNAQKYLDAMDGPTETVTAVLSSDIIPAVRAPWRRLFARSLDIMMYSALWSIFLMLVCNVNVSNRSTGGQLLDASMTALLILAVEPLLLTLFGTTLGKWILGLRVTDADDRRLTYSSALSRTWKVFLRGMGLNIPIYNLVRLWKSYKACDEGETLEWEYESTLSLKDKKVWRALVFACTYAAAICIIVLAMSVAGMPRHRGDITTAEFSDNFNRLAAYYAVDYGALLDDTGKWVKNEKDVIVVYIGRTDTPDFLIAESNGTVTEVSFQFETTDNEIWPPSCQNQMILTAMSFACSQKGFGFFSGARKELMEHIKSHQFEDFSFSEAGIVVDCDVEYSGYEDFGGSLGYLWPKEGSQTSYSLSFSIRSD